MEELNEILKHSGIKGMKWGVRRSNGKGQNDSKKVKKPGRIREELNSLSRERQWKKVLADVDKLSTKDINTTARRIQMENDLKRLASSKKEKQDYRRRANMSDEEMARKVVRLRAKDSLTRAVNDASKAQVELGKKISDIAQPLIVKQALGKKVDANDIFEAVKNPSNAKGKMRDDLMKVASEKAAGAFSKKMSSRF